MKFQQVSIQHTLTWELRLTFFLEESRQTREKAKNSKIDELKRLKEQNDDLAEYVRKLESYENIGSVRDDLSYRKLKTESERHTEKVQYEIENPPFVTPTIEIPELPDIPSPRENQGRVEHTVIYFKNIKNSRKLKISLTLLQELAIEITKIKKMNESEKILISQMKKEISETKNQILIKREVLGLPEKISLDPIRSIELDHMHEIPTLSIPIQNDIHFTIDWFTRDLFLYHTIYLCNWLINIMLNFRNVLPR